MRGQIISLRERRYIDLEAVASLENQVIEANDRLGRRTVEYLLRDEAFRPYVEKIQHAAAVTGQIKGGKEGRELQKQLDDINGQLNLLVETVSQLQIEDVTQRTKIVDPIGDLFGSLNKFDHSLRRELESYSAAKWKQILLRRASCWIKRWLLRLNLPIPSPY